MIWQLMQYYRSRFLPHFMDKKHPHARSIDGVMPRPVVERLMERVQHHLALLPVLRMGPPKVTIGHLGVFAAAKGAALLPMYKRYFSRAWNHFGA